MTIFFQSWIFHSWIIATLSKNCYIISHNCYLIFHNLQLDVSCYFLSHNFIFLSHSYEFIPWNYLFFFQLRFLIVYLQRHISQLWLLYFTKKRFLYTFKENVLCKWLPYDQKAIHEDVFRSAQHTFHNAPDKNMFCYSCVVAPLFCKWQTWVKQITYIF